MKKMILAALIAATSASNAFSATVSCANGSIKGDYVAKAFGVRNGNSVAEHYTLNFDGQSTGTGTDVKTGKVTINGFNSSMAKGDKYGDVVDEEGLYSVQTNCFAMIVFSPTGEKTDRIIVNLELTDMVGITKKPSTANQAFGTFVRDGVGYTFEMTRWIQAK